VFQKYLSITKYFCNFNLLFFYGGDGAAAVAMINDDSSGSEVQ